MPEPTNKEYVINSIRELVLDFPDELLDEFCKTLPAYIREVRAMRPLLESKIPGMTATHNLFDAITFHDDGIDGTTRDIQINIKG